MTFYQSQRRSFVTCFYVSLFLLLTVHVKVSTASLELLSLPWVYMCLCIYALMMNVPFYMCGCMHKFSCVPTYICTVYLPAEFECALFSKSVYIWSISEVPPLDQQNWQWCVCKAVPGLHFFKGLKVTFHHIYTLSLILVVLVVKLSFLSVLVMVRDYKNTDNDQSHLPAG